MKILVEGKQRDTLAGHADLSGFFDVSAVNQLSTQLQIEPVAFLTMRLESFAGVSRRHRFCNPLQIGG